MASVARKLLLRLTPDNVLATFQHNISAPETPGDIVGDDEVVPHIACIPADTKAPIVIRDSAPMQKIVHGAESAAYHPASRCWCWH